MGGKSKKNSLRESQQSGASALLAKNGAAPCGFAAEADGKSPGRRPEHQQALLPGPRR